MEASSDLRRLTEKLVYPSTPLTHTQTRTAQFVYPSASETAQHLLCKSHTRIARVHSEVLNRVRQWTSVTPRPLHLGGSLHCQTQKRASWVLRNRLTSQDFGGSFLFSSFFALNCICSTLTSDLWGRKCFIVWIWSFKTRLSLESQLMTSTELSSHPQLHFPARRELKKGSVRCKCSGCLRVSDVFLKGYSTFFWK